MNCCFKIDTKEKGSAVREQIGKAMTRTFLSKYLFVYMWSVFEASFVNSKVQNNLQVVDATEIRYAALQASPNLKSTLWRDLLNTNEFPSIHSDLFSVSFVDVPRLQPIKVILFLGFSSTESAGVLQTQHSGSTFTVKATNVLIQSTRSDVTPLETSRVLEWLM